MAKSADNPCPFKEAVDKKDSPQPRQKHSIMQSAKNISYSINRQFRQASKLVQHGFDSHSVRFCDDVILATYDDREASGAIKLLHMLALILRTRRDLKSLVYLCGQAPDTPKQPKIIDQYGLPTQIPSALKQEPTLISLPSKELRRLKEQQEKYNDLPKSERRRLKKKRQAAQKKLQTVKPPEEAKAAVKANQRKIRTEPLGRRKLRSLIYKSGVDGHYPTEELNKEAKLKILRTRGRRAR